MSARAHTNSGRCCLTARFKCGGKARGLLGGAGAGAAAGWNSEINLAM